MHYRLQKYIKKYLDSGENLPKVLFLLPYRVSRKLQKQLYRRMTRNSIFFEEKEMDMCELFPEKQLNEVLNMFNPNSVLDLGCGIGKSLDFFKDNNISVMGIEGSPLARSKAKNPHLIKIFNLNNELNIGQKFDLVWSFEFVEHIHPKYVDKLLNSFSNHADNVVISAARPGQGGEGHFNEQLPSYWIKKFAEKGYKFDKEKTNQFLAADPAGSQNMLVFVRKS